MTSNNTNHMFTFSHIIMITTTVTTALISGLFYAWSCSVIPGLAKVSDSTYLEAMQQMNRAILNPVFILSFMGTVFLLPLCTYLQYGPVLSARFWFLLLASVIYLGGTFGVTMFGNVPLNNMLDAFQLSGATSEDLAAIRAKFEQPWIYLHTIRTIANVIALILVVMACLSPAPVAERIAYMHRP